jgi:hypothetical protein
MTSDPDCRLAAVNGETSHLEARPGQEHNANRTQLERAFGYGARGWHVMPIFEIRGGRCSCGKGATCPSPGKHPRTMNGVKDASRSPEQIREWFTTWPEANIALATGMQSGVFAVDIDQRSSGFTSIDAWETERGEPLPNTLVALTGGAGRHLFFAYPASPVPNRNGWLQGVDVKSDGGYVVLPDSNHVSGGHYRWLDEMVPIAPAPADLVSSIQQIAGPKAGSFDLGLTMMGLPDGKRDDGLFRFACWARRVFRDDRKLVTLATREMAARAVPPFPEAEAMKCIDQAFKQDHDEVAAQSKLWQQSLDASAGWDAPVPLASKDNLPEFPIDFLPPAVRDMVAGVAESTQTPPDLAAGLALSVLSAATVGRVSIRVVGDWRESTSIYFVGLIESANRKSAVLSVVAAPLWGVQARMRDALAPEIQRRKREIEKLEKTKSNLGKYLGKGDVIHDAAYDDAASALEIARAALPANPLLVVDDATPEAIAQEMNRQGERLAVFDAEGGGLVTMTGVRYGGKDSGPYLDLLLKGHAGDPTGSIRVGREPVAMERPVLVIGVLSQPETLRELRGVSGSEGRGLIGRLMLAAPRDLLGERKIESQPIDPAVSQRWDTLVTQLVSRLWGVPAPVEVSLTREALVLVREFQHEVEDRLRQDGDLRELASFGGKVVGAAVRYAAMHHLGKYGSNGIDAPWVYPESIEAGIAIARWSIEHHRWAVYAGGWRPEVAGADRLLRWLGEGRIPEFSLRDALRQAPGFREASSLDEPLTLLEEHGYVRALGVERTGRKGRPPSARFAVNPAVWQVEQ